MSVVAATRGRFLEESIDLADNELTNSLFAQRNYPVWTSFNGYSPTDASYTSNTGIFRTFAYWRHYSPLYNDGYGSYVGLQMLDRIATSTGGPRGNNARINLGINKLLSFAAAAQPRIMKIYGAESLFGSNSSGPQNNNADRGNGYVGEQIDQNHTRIVGNAGNSLSGNLITGSISSSTSLNSTSMWTRSDWTQIIDIPNNVTTVKFGAQIKVAADDKLRPYNFAGIYCAEDRNPASGVFKRYVNYFRVKNNSGNYDLPTGTISSSMSPYNWQGLTLSGAANSAGDLKYYTPTSTVVTEHAALNQDDYEDFTKVEYSFTPQQGTGRKMSLNIFFSENTYYLYQAAGAYTGGFQVFDPYVEFS